MEEKKQWIVWTSKNKKKPFAPWTGRNHPIDPLDSDNWTSFRKALKFVRHGDYDGLGFVFTVDDDFVGFDLDDGVDDIEINGESVRVETDEVHGKVLTALDSFTEVSQSGNGLHVIVKGDLDEYGGQVTDKDVEIEIYDRGRFFCMTGKVVTEYDMSVNDAQTDIGNIVEAFVSEDKIDSSSPSNDYSNDRSGSGSGSFDADSFEPESDSEFDRLSFFDIFEDKVKAGQHVSHPVHGSRTESNFLVHNSDGFVATCFRGDCNYQNGPTCVLLPHHVLAMEMKGWEHCPRVREAWDLELRIETWIYAVEEYGVNPMEIPTSIKAGLGKKYDVDPFAGGSESVSISNFLKRKLKDDYEVYWFE